MSVGQHIKTETFKRSADLFSRQRELMKQGVRQFSLSYVYDTDEGGELYEMSYPFRDEELGPSGPDGGNSPELYADEERRAA